ncbi:MAG: cellulase family glycosylhydrolase, partial [Deltaproteobacteria bacterium]|nr:cellulase family glycosylhydrolase [Deltaproteobacteria bacterium]
MKRILLAALMIAAASSSARAQPGLTRSGAALMYNGQPVTLVAYGCYGILTESAFDYEAFFDALEARGINFVRVWGNYHWTNDLIPFKGTRNDADLTKLNPAYFERLKAMVAAAAARDIVVMFTFWDSCALEGPADSGNRWINCPYRTGNNDQSYCASPNDFDDVPPDVTPPIWTQSHAPYMAKVVQTIGAYGNVIYEIMNEPYPGFGGDAFINYAIDYLYGLLNDPGVPGSRIIATNDGPQDHVGNPKVDVVSFHLNSPDKADDFNGLARPVIISNDGDTSQSSTSMANPQRIQRIALFADKALASGAAPGHNHLEILDKDIYGATWKSQDYDPKAGNVTQGILDALAPYANGLPTYDCPDYDHIIDDQDKAPQFTMTGDDWATWGTAGCGFDGGDTSYHYLSKTVGGDDKKGKAFWKPDLPVSGTYEISTWWRKTANRTTDADHYIHDGTGGVTHLVIDQKGDAQPEGSTIPFDCFSGWYSLGEYFCAAGVAGCYVELDGTDDNQSDEANAMRFTLKECSGGPVDPPPDPVQTCDFPGEGSHTVKVYADKITANGWENTAQAEGEPDGQDAHSPNVETGEFLTADFTDLCDPDGVDTIDKVMVGVLLRTQYESGKYDVILKFHAGGNAVLTTHHTQLEWDHLDITGDKPSWTWKDVAGIKATLELDYHPQGKIDSDVWVDAFYLEVTYTTQPPDCQDKAFECKGDDLLLCEGWTWVLYEQCEAGCADQACLPPPGQDSAPEKPDVATPPPEDAVMETVSPWDANPDPDAAQMIDV